MPNPFTIPGAPQGLLDKINARRLTIPAGMVMEADADAQKDASKTDPPADGTKTNEKAADKDEKTDDADKLGEGGLKALQAEREARKALEAQVKTLEPLKAQMDAIAAAFGAKPGEKTPDVADQIADLQKRLADMDAKAQHDADVDAVLNTADKLGKYGDRLSAADVSLLRTLPSREAMEAVAKRLIEGAKPGVPKPDRSVAQSGSGSTSGGTVTAGRDLFRDRHNKTKTT